MVLNYFKLGLIFIILPIGSFSQDFDEIYEVDKFYNGNKLYSKLKLSSNGTYHKKTLNTGHQLESFEEKGSWYKKNDTLYLQLERLVVFPEFPESEWKDFTRKDVFLVKRKRIIPIYDKKKVLKI